MSWIQEQYIPEESWGWHGLVRVTIRTTDGGLEVVEFPNLIVDVGKTLMRDALRGTVSDAKIRYVAIGTSSTSPAGSDTQLGAEAFRFPVTSQTTSGTNGTITNVYISPAQAVGTAIAEIGWFAGSTATATANSGVLVAHVLYSHTKTAVESLQLQRTDTFS